jgi:hypothetical protein
VSDSGICTFAHSIPSEVRMPVLKSQMFTLRLWAIGMVAVLGTSVAVAQAPRPQPRGENLSAGKTPAELFAIDCASCHRNPAALAKGRRAAQLSNFLAEHYTTSQHIARSLGTYLATLPTAPTVERTQQPPAAADDPTAGAGSRAPSEATAVQAPADTAPKTEPSVPEPRTIAPPVPPTLDTLEVYD